MAIESTIGFGGSQAVEAKILNGGAWTDPIDMGRNYAFFVIYCASMTGVGTAGKLTASASIFSGTALATIYEANDPATQWSKTLPTTGSMYFRLDHAWGARFLKLTMTVAADADLTFYIVGFDPVVFS
jgi:hypothetical protein